jgi:hypothetical protein
VNVVIPPPVWTTPPTAALLTQPLQATATPMGLPFTQIGGYGVGAVSTSMSVDAAPRSITISSSQSTSLQSFTSLPSTTSSTSVSVGNASESLRVKTEPGNSNNGSLPPAMDDHRELRRRARRAIEAQETAAAEAATLMVGEIGEDDAPPALEALHDGATGGDEHGNGNDNGNTNGNGGHDFANELGVGSIVEQSVQRLGVTLLLL